MLDISEVPIANEDPVFGAQEKARVAALHEAESATDDPSLYEAICFATHIWQQQIEGVSSLLDTAGSRSKFDPNFPAFSVWLEDWMAQDIHPWADRQNELVESLGRDQAQRIADERVTPRIEKLMEEVKELLRQKLRDAGGDPSIIDEPPSAPRSEASDPTTAATPAALADTKVCPDCAEEVKAAARKCRFCGFRFDEEPASSE